jgi:hypothetical protein
MNTHEPEPEVVTAEYFATLSNGKIVTLGDCCGTQPQELLPCQIALSKEEYYLLHAVIGKCTPDEIIKLAKAIKAKVAANGS